MLIQFHKHASKQSQLPPLQKPYICLSNTLATEVEKGGTSIMCCVVRCGGPRCPRPSTGGEWDQNPESSPSVVQSACCMLGNGDLPAMRLQASVLATKADLSPRGGRSQPRREWWAALKRSPSFKKYKEDEHYGRGTCCVCCLPCLTPISLDLHPTSRA